MARSGRRDDGRPDPDPADPVVTVVEARSPCTTWSVLVVVHLPAVRGVRRWVGTLSVRPDGSYGILERSGGVPARFDAPDEAAAACRSITSGAPGAGRARRWIRPRRPTPERSGAPRWHPEVLAGTTFVVTPADGAPGPWPGWLDAGPLVSP